VARPLMGDVLRGPAAPTVERRKHLLDLLRRAVGLVMHLGENRLSRTHRRATGQSDRPTRAERGSRSLTKPSFAVTKMREIRTVYACLRGPNRESDRYSPATHPASRWG